MVQEMAKSFRDVAIQTFGFGSSAMGKIENCHLDLQRTRMTNDACTASCSIANEAFLARVRLGLSQAA